MTGSTMEKKVIRYDIATEEGKKFCECVRNGDEVILITKEGPLRLLNLLEQVANPLVAENRRAAGRNKTK